MPYPQSFAGEFQSRAFYSASVARFLQDSESEVVGALSLASTFPVEPLQRDAWLEQIGILRSVMEPYATTGWLAFEYAVPRVGRRIDVLAVIRHAVFVLEFKAGEQRFTRPGIEQVWDYALDLKNFHSTSHDKTIVPVFIPTQAQRSPSQQVVAADRDGLLRPLCSTAEGLGSIIESVLAAYPGAAIDVTEWASGRYHPTPTIIEAATALYNRHSVAEIARNDASAINLARTSERIAEIIRSSRTDRRKSLCFVTGVPGSGKTLVGLNTATRHSDVNDDLHTVFLSGNDPLVSVLREALARDKVRREAGAGRVARLGAARSEVRAFIQNVHHFRDECLLDPHRPPVEHVALFDEAQRAWNEPQTSRFMLQKKKRPNFAVSEPEFLISCMDRHKDWAVVVCLVGGGQEINRGEAGIGEWIRAVVRSFPDWCVHLSPRLTDSEYAAGGALEMLQGHSGLRLEEELHLSVSMRSFRAESVSGWVKRLLDLDSDGARGTLGEFGERYPVVLTRDLSAARDWLRSKARGSERYGLVVSSQAQRLKPHAIDVRAPVSPIHWFLNTKDDVRSSFYLEDAATEFHVQGLELDWAGVVWDGDFRHSETGWGHWSFRGNRWQRIRSEERQTYLKNAYRVLLTRARQGMVIVVPRGDPTDSTRDADFYDGTFRYLSGLGLSLLQ